MASHRSGEGSAVSEQRLQELLSALAEYAANDGPCMCGQRRGRGRTIQWMPDENGYGCRFEVIEVKSGEVIDFVVDGNATPDGDECSWAPKIKLSPHGSQPPELFSDSAQEFRGPAAQLLTPWEQLALVMLQSNELVFVD